MYSAGESPGLQSARSWQPVMGSSSSFDQEDLSQLGMIGAAPKSLESIGRWVPLHLSTSLTSRSGYFDCEMSSKLDDRLTSLKMCSMPGAAQVRTIETCVASNASSVKLAPSHTAVGATTSWTVDARITSPLPTPSMKRQLRLVLKQASMPTLASVNLPPSEATAPPSKYAPALRMEVDSR